jgi:lipoprotein-releasing system permease protein
VSDGVLWLILALGVLAALAIAAALAIHDIAGVVARRFLSHMKPTMVPVIGVCAVASMTLAIATLIVVRGVSTGLQADLQRRVLGVTPHVVVLKHGFTDYGRVMEAIGRMPGVEGVNPFVLDKAMLVADAHLAAVQLKGVDPLLLHGFFAANMAEGSLADLRPPGSLRTRRQTSPPPPFSDDEDPARVGITSERRADGGAEAAVLDDAVAEALGVEGSEPTADGSSDPVDLPGIVPGRRLANELHLETGETVRVMTPRSGKALGFPEPASSSMRSREFRVAGIFYTGFEDYDRSVVFIDLSEAQAFNDLGNEVSGLELRLEDPTRAPDFAEELRRALGCDVYQITTWQDLDRTLFTTLNLQKVVLTAVASALVLAPDLLIVATLVMLIFEKKRAIAILKALGATDFAILRVFVYVGLVIGGLGTFLGLSLGYGICVYLIEGGRMHYPDVYLVDRWPVAIMPADYLFISCGSLGLSFLSSLVPSWLTAARLEPAEGLRYE